MSKRREKPFVKSADTDVSVDKSIEEIKTLVRKYGAAGFGVKENYQTGMSAIELMLPDLPGQAARVPLRIPVNVQRVYEALYVRGQQANQYTSDPKHIARRREQAERTAWRHAFYTIEVALMTAQLGGRPVSESLMADVVVVDDHGNTERMGDYVARTGGALAPGIRALLPGPTSEQPK